MEAPSSKTTPENLKQRLKESYDAIAPRYNEWTVAHSARRIEYLDRLLELLEPRLQACCQVGASRASADDVIGSSGSSSSSSSSSSGTAVRILELGCGCGLPVTQALLSHHPAVRVTANDMSSTQVALARENLAGFLGGGGGGGDEARLKLVEGDMMALRDEDLMTTTTVTTNNDDDNNDDDNNDNSNTTTTAGDGSLIDAAVALYSLIHLPRDEQTAMLRRVASWLAPGGFLLANFAAEAAEHVVLPRWLREDAGWMYWSAWGAEGTIRAVAGGRGHDDDDDGGGGGGAGLEIVAADVVPDPVDDASFLWIIARKPGGPDLAREGRQA